MVPSRQWSSQGSTEKCPLDVTTERSPVTCVRAAAEGLWVGPRVGGGRREGSREPGDNRDEDWTRGDETQAESEEDCRFYCHLPSGRPEDSSNSLGQFAGLGRRGDEGEVKWCWSSSWDTPPHPSPNVISWFKSSEAEEPGGKDVGLGVKAAWLESGLQGLQAG